MKRIRRIVLGLLLVPASIVAQERELRPLPAPRDANACVIATKVAGAWVGFLTGAFVGYLVERAFYPGVEDAGITGLSLGGLAGAFAGMQLAPRVCREPDEASLRSTSMGGTTGAHDATRIAEPRLLRASLETIAIPPSLALPLDRRRGRGRAPSS